MATFFPDVTLLTFDRRRTGPSVLSREGRQYVVIDDMVFDVDTMIDIEIRAFTGTKWPNGEVFFEFASGISQV